MNTLQSTKYTVFFGGNIRYFFSLCHTVHESQGFCVFSRKKESVRAWGTGLPLFFPRPDLGTDASAAATAGDPGHARGGPDPQGKTLGRAEAPLSPAVQPTSTHPHLRITEMILAKSKWRAWGFVCCYTSPPPVLEPTLPSSSWTIF